jgi:hypothetical protein
MVPPFVNPDQSDVHWGYYYSANGRPGVGVREFVGTAQSATVIGDLTPPTDIN